MQSLKYALAAIVVLALGWFLWGYLLPEVPPIVVQPKPEYNEVAYIMVDQAGGQISLTFAQKGINKGLLHLRSNSRMSFNWQINAVARLLDRLLRSEDKTAIDSLFVGRLIDIFGPGNFELSKRLALAAYKSAKWDKKAGKPVAGNPNAFVKEIVNEALIYAELREVFRRHGLDIKCVSIEKVLVGSPVKYIPFGGELKAQGVKDFERLPFDGLAWFSVSKYTR